MRGAHGALYIQWLSLVRTAHPTDYLLLPLRGEGWDEGCEIKRSNRSRLRGAPTSCDLFFHVFIFPCNSVCFCGKDFFLYFFSFYLSVGSVDAVAILGAHGTPCIQCLECAGMPLAN
jgi:hypothetical protein